MESETIKELKITSDEAKTLQAEVSELRNVADARKSEIVTSYPLFSVYLSFTCLTILACCAIQLTIYTKLFVNHGKQQHAYKKA